MIEPLVSILTPFKNTAAYLGECLESILDQSYSNWELIIIDDHSTDASHHIVSDYALKDQRIKLHKAHGHGIIEALRQAFHLSNGQLITRMDSDDIMTKQKLEVLVTNLLSCGRHHVAIGGVRYFSEAGISDGYASYETWLNDLTRKGNNYSEIYKECVIPSPCWMVYRDDLIASGAFTPDRYPEDYDLTFRFYANNLKCIPCHDIIHLWRDYATRTSRTHEHYALNHFLQLKTHYFLELDRDDKRPLVIWGAGMKGKTAAKLLIERKVPFYWICDNPKKIGKQIYGQQLRPFEFLSMLDHPQSMITVANKDAQKEIRSYLTRQKMVPMTDYFFFC